MNDKNEPTRKKIKLPLGAGSPIYFLITLVLFLIALIWMKDGYVESDGTTNVLLIIFTIATFIISLLLCIIPKKHPWVFIHKHGKIFNEVFLLLIAVSSVLIFNGYSTRYNFLEALSHRSVFYYVGNILLAFLVAQILYLIFHNIITVCDIITIASLVLSGLNYYVVGFRGLPVAPWDVKAAFTAAEVASGYVIIATPGIVIGLCIMILMHQIISCVPWYDNRRRVKEEGIRAIVIVLLIVVAWLGLTKTVKVRFYDQAGYYDEMGNAVGFLSYVPYVSYSEPEGYDAAEVEQILSKTELVDANPDKTTATNIIIVMNESLADLDVISDKLSSTNNGTDYLYNIHHLDNSARGLLYVPTYGGNTCNTEFEFETEASYYNMMGTPFLTFVNKDESVKSIADTVEGYVANAFHPYNPKGWNRTDVYKSLGFNKLWSNQDMTDEEINTNTVRSFVSDSNNYKVLNRIMSETEGNKKLIYNITLQNHGGYIEQYDDFTSDVDLSSAGDFPDAETYLGLVKKSDEAFMELVDSYRNSSEPTIIVMFGDHQPALDTKFYDYLYGNEIKDRTVEELQKQYITPYVIWSNYDVDYNNAGLNVTEGEEKYNAQSMSANYLFSIIKRLANLPLDNYESYIYNMYKSYPVVNAYGVYDSDGNYYAPDSGIFDNKMLQDYSKIQYYRLHQ